MINNDRGAQHDASPLGWMGLSLTLDEVRAIKTEATCGAPYAERIGVGLAVRLLDMRQKRGDDHLVLHEINVLEGFVSASTTKPASQFKRPPLHPLWHKHFSAPRHLLPNIGLRWGIENGGNQDLAKMLNAVARDYGDQPGVWQHKAVYDFVIGGLQDRSSVSRMTGDWIILGKHCGQNYYLDLASHEEGRDDAGRLLTKLRSGSAWEFPFLFTTDG